jgi:hypothetical protein
MTLCRKYTPPARSNFFSPIFRERATIFREMLRLLASAAKWLGLEGVRAFGACRALKEMQPPQPGLQYLVIDHYGWEAMYFDKFADRDGRCIPLYRAFKQALWEAVRSDFCAASLCTHVRLRFLSGFNRVVELNENGISTMFHRPWSATSTAGTPSSMFRRLENATGDGTSTP